MVSQLKPDNLLPAIEGDLKKKVITNESLDDAISYLINMGYLPEAITKADIQCWSVTSDSTAYLIYQQDTFRLASAYHTLKTPLGIALVK